MSEAAIYRRDPDWSTQVWGSRADWRGARVTRANQLLPLIWIEARLSASDLWGAPRLGKEWSASPGTTHGPLSSTLSLDRRRCSILVVPPREAFRSVTSVL